MPGSAILTLPTEHVEADYCLTPRGLSLLTIRHNGTLLATRQLTNAFYIQSPRLQIAVPVLIWSSPIGEFFLLIA